MRGVGFEPTSREHSAAGFKPTVSTNSMILRFPIDGFPITRDSDAHIADGQEAGIDIACPEGTPLLAVHDGVAWFVGEMGDCGLACDLVWDEHATMLDTARYCHLSSIAVEQTDVVKAGQVIGYAGSTGLATGPHLHLALYRDGERLRPEDYFGEEEPWMPANMREVIDLMWEKLDAIQALGNDEATALAEEVKQSCVVRLKALMGL